MSGVSGQRAVIERPLGQGATLQHLVRLARRLCMHHGVVIEAPQGCGKTTVARWLAAALLCEGDSADEPCGTCNACSRLAADNHPDVHPLTVPEDKRDIPVDLVRDAMEVLLRTDHGGRARVLCIDPADRLNEQGQNALLKTLEEPGPRTFLLVCTARPEALLPTVRSRVLRLRVRPLPPSVLRGELSRRLPAVSHHVDRAIAAAGGSLGLAMELCTERAVQLQDVVQATLVDLDRLRAVPTARAALAGAEGQKEAVSSARMFLLLLRAALGSTVRAELEALESAGPATYASARASRWTTLVECTLRAEEDLDLQIPAEQAIVSCLLQMQAAGRSS